MSEVPEHKPDEASRSSKTEESNATGAGTDASRREGQRAGSGARSSPDADGLRPDLSTRPDGEVDSEVKDVKIDDLDAAAQAVEVDLEALLAEREQFLDAYRRAQADFENYRKQAQKRQEDAVARALGGFVERLLPVLDAIDAAEVQGASGAVEPIMSALFGALEKEGLERIDPKGEPFDPAVAEAVVHEPGEGGAQVVSEVLRAGYRWQGRLLRPALVKVTD